MSGYLVKIARLGGYLAHASDPSPGNIVMWRGLSRLTDIKLGATIGAELMGNRKLHRRLTMKKPGLSVRGRRGAGHGIG